MKFKTRTFCDSLDCGVGRCALVLTSRPVRLTSEPARSGGSRHAFSPLVLKALKHTFKLRFSFQSRSLWRCAGSTSGVVVTSSRSTGRREKPVAALEAQIVPGLIGGLAGGIAISPGWLLWKPFLPPTFVTRAEQLNRSLPFPTRLLFGGITEELLLRWGVMTLLVWLWWRLLQKGKGKHTPSGL
jgi:hypothetical protein